MYNIEIPQLWPRWMNCYNSPASGSLFNLFYQGIGLDAYSNIYNSIDVYGRERLFQEWGQHRVEWVCEYPYETLQSLSFGTFTSGVTGSAPSEFTFLASITPVFFAQDGTIRFRNLDYQTTSTTPASDLSTTLTASGVDRNIWYKQFGGWERIAPKSTAITGTSVYLPTSLPVDIVWYPNSLTSAAATGNVFSFSNALHLTLTQRDAWNRWDEVASLGALKRFKFEDNYNLYLRSKAKNYLSKTSGDRRVAQNVSVETDTVTTLTWVPSGSITLSDYGILDAVYITVIGLNQEYTVREIPYKVGYNSYKLSKVPIDGSLFVYTLGTQSVPASSLSNSMTPLRPITTSPEVQYRYRTYNLTRSSNGFITMISPVSGNVGCEEFQVYITRGIRNYTLSTGYLDKLYTGAGLPTPLLVGINQDIKERVRVTLGYCVWSNSYWLSDPAFLECETDFIRENFE